MKKVAVVIPYYKNNLSKDEKISLNHLNKYLSKYDKILIVPESLKRISVGIKNAGVVRFPSKYFKSTAAYSELLNTKEFYNKFLNYEYILIYQFDALVFSDQLADWYKSGFDYIGAPLFNSLIGKLTSPNKELKQGGNGGLSLRRVRSFIKVLDEVEKSYKRSSEKSYIRKLWLVEAIVRGKSREVWLNARASDYPFNEDGFWSFEAAKYYPKFKVAPLKKAVQFSFERFPEECLKMTKGKLPFGCHGWVKYGKEFWEPFLIRQR